MAASGLRGPDLLFVNPLFQCGIADAENFRGVARSQKLGVGHQMVPSGKGSIASTATASTVLFCGMSPKATLETDLEDMQIDTHIGVTYNARVHSHENYLLPERMLS